MSKKKRSQGGAGVPMGTPAAGGAGPLDGGGGKGRFSARRKGRAVLRLIQGESLEVLSRELGVTAATLSEWRDTFLVAGEASLKSREPDARDDHIRDLHVKIGKITMENELLYERARRLEAANPLAYRRRNP